MRFKDFANKSISVPTNGWYHGTHRGDDLRNSEPQVSTSGGGQRGLKGFWLTRDVPYAQKYSNALRSEPGTPEILEYELAPNLNIANLVDAEGAPGWKNHVDNTKARWAFVGIDIDDMEQTQVIRDLQPFALTKILIQQGYDGAMIPNTIERGGSPELCIFDPKNVKIAN